MYKCTDAPHLYHVQICYHIWNTVYNYGSHIPEKDIAETENGAEKNIWNYQRAGAASYKVC